MQLLGFLPNFTLIALIVPTAVAHPTGAVLDTQSHNSFQTSRADIQMSGILGRSYIHVNIKNNYIYSFKNRLGKKLNIQSGSIIL